MNMMLLKLSLGVITISDPIQLSFVTISDGTSSEDYEMVDETARGDIGALSSLLTTAKTNLVAAINELYGEKVAWVTYGTSTSAEIEAAYQAGKVVLCTRDYNGYYFYFYLASRNSATAHMFGNIAAWMKNGSPALSGMGCICDNDVWTGTSYYLAKADDIGDLSNLTTTAKNNLVAAINETAADLTNKADKITEVTVSTAGAVTQALDAGKIYHFTGALTSLTLTLTAAPSGNVAQYHFDFDSGSTAPTVTLPQTVTMPSGFQVEANKHYEIDILDGYGLAASWATS